MVIGVVNLKGGVGKTTVSQNLAVGFAHRGYKVCLLDTDLEQKSSMRWSEIRGEAQSQQPNIKVVGVMGESVPKVVEEEKKHYDIVIIDGNPHLGKATTKTMLAADFVIVPVTSSGFDLWSVESFYERFSEVKDLKGDDFKGYVILNRYSGNTNIDKEMKEAITEFGFNVLESTLGYRVAYKEAPVAGMGALEYKDPKAREEVTRLLDEVEIIIKALI